MADQVKQTNQTQSGNLTPTVDLNSKLQGHGGGVGKGVERMETPAQINVPVATEAAIEAVEVPTSPEIEKKPDVASYVEEVEKAAELSGTLMDDYTGQVLLNPAQQQKQVVLPMNEAQIQEGLHHQVWEGVRWMAEWCVRQIKLLHGKVTFKN